MVRLLELRIPDIGLAMLAPIFWLSKESAGVRQKVWVGNLPSISSILTSCPPSRIPYVRLTGVAIQPFRVFDTKLKCLRISQKAALYVNIRLVEVRRSGMCRREGGISLLASSGKI